MRIPRAPSRLAATRCAALALCVLAPGCFSTLYGWPRTPEGFRPAEGTAGPGCPDLSGTYQNGGSWSTRVSGNGQLDGSPRPSPRRHLTAFFTGDDDLSAVERVTFYRPSDRELKVTFEGTGGASREVLLREGADYVCEHGHYRFVHSPHVRRRWGGSISFARGGRGCLLERTLERDGIGFFLVIPALEQISGEWNLFCPPDAAAAQEPRLEASP